MKLLAATDRRLAKVILSLPDTYRPFLSGATFIGEPTVVIATAFLAYVSAAIRGQNKVQSAVFYSVIAFCINILLKMLIHRARPNDLDVEMFGIRSYSFPSGHAFGSVIFYGLFAVMDMKYLARPCNIVISALIWIVIFLIGVSRVYLKKHYPTDVLAGWILGGLSLAIVVWLAL
jgi:undecaprenyl-diphosphatase